MKILVTGGAGFIGSHIVDLLIKNNYRVIAIDNLSSGKIENLNPKAKFYQEDLGNFEEIRKIIEIENPEVIYHLAAQINVRKSVENPIQDAKINIINTLNLLELAVKSKVKHFIFSSTGGALYGDSNDIPTIEAAVTNPVSPYGCSKLSVEKYLIFYNKVHGLKFTALRYSNVYGPRQNPEGEAGVIAIFLDKMFANQQPKIFGGIQKRDFIYVEDVAQANLLALNDSSSNFYNVGTSRETDIIEIFNKLNSYFDNKFRPEYLEMKKGEQKTSCLSYKKINNSLGWHPLTGIDDGLDKTYCWKLREFKKKRGLNQ